MVKREAMTVLLFSATKSRAKNRKNQTSATMFVCLSHNAFSDGTERNAIDTTLPNEKKIFVPFGSVGGRRRSF
uniref:Secreted protein n=1 Tax=Romanomermis culicivorax TaxID=13658 RepID=A0A915IKD9_ROMCU